MDLKKKTIPDYFGRLSKPDVDQYSATRCARLFNGFRNFMAIKRQ